MNTRKPVTWLMLIILACQSAWAVADTHAVHQADSSHQQAALAGLDHALDIDHHVDDQHGASQDIASDNCTHCCHCHGSTFIFSELSAPEHRRETAQPVSDKQSHYSVSLSTLLRPPAC